MKIIQMHLALILGDAVSNQMLELDAQFRAWGFETALFAQHIAPEMVPLARPDREYLDYLHDPDHLLIYHYGLYTPSVRYFRASRGRRILLYHNITPAHFFRGWSAEQELLCEVGRRTLPSLASCDLALGVSELNRRELIEAGFAPERTGLLPISLSQGTFDAVPTNQALLKQLRSHRGVNVLSVGRIVPNKAVEDLIRIFYVYHQAVNPRSHLYLVGSRYLAAYDQALDELVEALGLQQNVTFTGLVPLSDLKSYYQAADLYLHASQHEGFCVPLLESMYFGVPILARKAGAVPETLGPAGVLFTRLGYEQVAEMAHLLVSDPVLRAQVLSRQRERLQNFAPERIVAELREILARVGVWPTTEEGSHV